MTPATITVSMSFSWLEMRVAEEKDRRKREAEIQKRLPHTLEDLHRMLVECVEAYTQEFGADSADVQLREGSVRATAHGLEVQVSADAALPGFRVDRRGEALSIEIGALPGDKLFYKHEERYLTEEQLTRLILDRVLFPELGE